MWMLSFIVLGTLKYWIHKVRKKFVDLWIWMVTAGNFQHNCWNWMLRTQRFKTRFSCFWLSYSLFRRRRSLSLYVLLGIKSEHCGGVFGALLHRELKMFRVVIFFCCYKMKSVFYILYYYRHLRGNWKCVLYFIHILYYIVIWIGFTYNIKKVL